MPHYLVYTGRKWENPFGKKGITWEIAGVYGADSEEDACLFAAQQLGAGTCFAVEGYAWGVDTVDAARVNQLGVEADPLTRLERRLTDFGERIANALPAPKQQTLEAGDDDGEG